MMELFQMIYPWAMLGFVIGLTIVNHLSHNMNKDLTKIINGLYVELEEKDEEIKSLKLLLTMTKRSLELKQYEPYEIIDDDGNKYIVKDGEIIKQ